MPGPQASTSPALFLYTLHQSVATCVWLPVNSGSLGSCPSHINGLGRRYLVISYFPIEAIVVGYSHSYHSKKPYLSVSCFFFFLFSILHSRNPAFTPFNDFSSGQWLEQEETLGLLGMFALKLSLLHWSYKGARGQIRKSKLLKLSRE